MACCECIDMSVCVFEYYAEYLAILSVEQMRLVHQIERDG